MTPIVSARAVVAITIVQQDSTSVTFSEEIIIPVQNEPIRDDLLPAVLSCIDTFRRALDSVPKGIAMANEFFSTE